MLKLVACAVSACLPGVILSRISRLLLLLACLIALPVSAQPTPTATPLPTLVGDYIVAQDIYVRGGPSETYLPVGRLIEGVAIIPVNISADGNWVLIRYSRGFGWIRRDLAFWTTDIDALPTLDESDLTPTVIATETPTLRPTGIRVEAGDQGAYVRFGPGVDFPHLGAVLTGNYVEPVGQNPEGTWILIRFRDGFGWVARSLLSREFQLNNLPVLQLDALTPSPTLPASDTPTITLTPPATETASATLTATLIPTNTPFLTATQTSTPTFPPTDTSTLIPTNTRTVTPSSTATNTDTPTNMASPTATSTFTATATDTAAPTHTFTPSPTETPTSTQTATQTPTRTLTATISPTTEEPPATVEATQEVLFTATAANTAVAEITSTPSETPSETTVEPEAIDDARVTPAINAGMDQLTQTRTATARATRTLSRTPTNTNTPTETSTPTSTLTNTPSNTATPQPSDTAMPSATETQTARPTATVQPSSTPTTVLTDLPAETESASLLVATETAAETQTQSPTITPTETHTATRVPTQTEAPTQAATLIEATEVITAEVSFAAPASPSAGRTTLPSATLSETPTEAATSTQAPSATSTSTPTPTRTSTPGVILPTPVSSSPEMSQPPASRVPPEALVGAALVALVIVYVGLYWRGLTVADRYTDGFVIDRCPVCQEGHLHVEMRRGRVFGIPQPRYSVRCDNCRSVLREAGSRRWRYAVDPTANPPIYNRFNGKVIDEPALRVLESQAIAKRSSQPPSVRPPGTLPTFVDDEE